MKFTVIGHSSLYVESGQTRLLVDPWLSGSCYWRSWWHYPPVEQIDDAWLEPTTVYLTHHHFDHFHYPSLRMIDKHAQVFIPRFAIDFMAGELRSLGFKNIEEMPHGKTVDLGSTLELTSYQYGFDDSAILIKDHSATIADFNDCKIRGRSLKRILNRHGHPTFLLKNHSWAQSYPHCYSSNNPLDLQILSREQYVADFIDTVHEAQPAYAIPFASNVCFLHPQTMQYNSIAISPFDIVRAESESSKSTSEIVIMGPGDSWSSTNGFDCQDWANAFDKRSEYITSLAQDVSTKIAASDQEECTKTLSFEGFKDHFDKFLKALPPASPLILKRPIIFNIPSDEYRYWVLDFQKRRVHREAALPADYASIVTVDDGLLADAIEKNIVSFLHISMRLSVALAPRGVDVDLMFWAFLALWDLGYLPLHRHLDRRTLGVAWRRRHELTDGVLLKLVGRGTLVERLATNLMNGDAQPDQPAAEAESAA